MSRRRAGFTLIELAIVIAISGLLASLAYAGFESMSTIGRVNGEAEVISQFLKLARLRSVSTGCAHVVRLTGLTWDSANTTAVGLADRGQLFLIREGNCNIAVPNDMLVTAGDFVVQRYTLERRVALRNTVLGNLTAQCLLFGFNPNGSYVSGVQTGPAAAGPAAVFNLSTESQDGTRITTLNISGAGNVSTRR